MNALTQGNEHYLTTWIGVDAIIAIIAICWMTIASVKTRVNEEEEEHEK